MALVSRHYIALARRMLSRRNIVIIILLAIGLSLFFSVYESVREQDDFATLDEPLLALVIAYQYPPLVTIMNIVTDVLSPIALSILVLVGSASWIWYYKKDIWRPLLLIGAMGLAFALSAGIKILTARDRPSVMDLIQSPAVSYSFPSGHTIGVATLLFVLGYFFCAAQPTLRRVLLWTAIAIAGIILVAFSRIYLTYHWLTDVTASVGLAFIILAIVIAIDTYKVQRGKNATSKAVSDTDQ
ncbi:MAG TPA: phosphatase PAP2 family protein [Candidatus Saccharimonadales bacterium]|nr:phosphatase PAP2 family protein [Candidatus Saccharimonadales bacterium]